MIHYYTYFYTNNYLLIIYKNNIVIFINVLFYKILNYNMIKNKKYLCRRIYYIYYIYFNSYNKKTNELIK